jgi:hypothetical protein
MNRRQFVMDSLAGVAAQSISSRLAAATAETFYVNVETGTDSNPGRSARYAWC